MNDKFLNQFKQLITRIGARLSRKNLVRIEALVNYLKVGRSMKDRGLDFPRRVSNREEVWSVVANEICDRKVLYLEFGVAQGASIRWWASQLKHPESILHGFDSFEGLPEGQANWVKGQFSTGGKFPTIDDGRVQFFKGWFDQVLPHYSLPEHDLLVINMDADLYSSTIYVLRWLRPYIKPGTFIYFDEINHLEAEGRAFDEFIEETGIQFGPVSADASLTHVLSRCTRVMEPSLRNRAQQPVAALMPAVA